MPYMFVTLDVSRLSGWLNADADCPAKSKRGYMKRGEARPQEVEPLWRAAEQWQRERYSCRKKDQLGIAGAGHAQS